MSDLIDAIAEPAGAHVRLSETVESVEYSSDVCVVSCAGGEEPYRARKVVVTVPVKVLQEGDIAFTPPLPPAKVSALGLYGMEDAAKLILVFRDRVWPEKVQSCIVGGSPIPEMWFRRCHKTGHHVCCCFATSKFAERLKGMGEAAAVKVARGLLEEMFGMSEGSELLDSRLMCWSDVPSVRGGYSYPKVGMSREAVEEVGRAVGGKLFFAGEATHVGAAMTVHAAMETGVEAARNVQRSLDADHD